MTAKLFFTGILQFIDPDTNAQIFAGLAIAFVYMVRKPHPLGGRAPFRGSGAGLRKNRVPPQLRNIIVDVAQLGTALAPQFSSRPMLHAPTP